MVSSFDLVCELLLGVFGLGFAMLLLMVRLVWLEKAGYVHAMAVVVVLV